LFFLSALLVIIVLVCAGHCGLAVPSSSLDVTMQEPARSNGIDTGAAAAKSEFRDVALPREDEKETAQMMKGIEKSA
jgi:hypothetical protein